MLKKEGFEVAAASNGREAIQILKSNKIAVVVTDLKMPDIDGMELLTRISEQHPEIPVIMITAHGTVATVRGPVSVSWRLTVDKLELACTAPEGTKVEFVKNDSLMGKTVVFNGSQIK